jgi:hypothetical protein
MSTDQASCYYSQGDQALTDDHCRHRLPYGEVRLDTSYQEGPDVPTERPRDRRADPPVQPEICTPVVTQYPMKDQGPHVLREGGSGTLSLFS